LPKRFVRVVLVVCALIAVSPIMPWDMAPVNESWNPGDDRPAISRPAPSAVVTNGMMGLKSAAARSAQIDESLALKNNAPPVAILERGSARSIEPAVARKNKVLVEQQLDGSMNEKVGDMETKQNAGLDRRHALLSFVTEAVEKVGPSVVRIDTETSLFGEDSGLSTSGLVQQGQGSGLIFTSDGLILTNAHVVEDVSKVTVTLMDGRVFEAEVCGTDEIVDIGTW
jgi:S1-C subfamily serine protease